MDNILFISRLNSSLKHEPQPQAFKNDADNRLSSQTHKLMSTLLDDPAFHRQKKNQSKSKRRYSLPKLKEPCPLTSDGTRLLESFPNNTNGGRRKSFF